MAWGSGFYCRRTLRREPTTATKGCRRRYETDIAAARRAVGRVSRLSSNRCRLAKRFAGRRARADQYPAYKALSEKLKEYFLLADAAHYTNKQPEFEWPRI